MLNNLALRIVAPPKAFCSVAEEWSAKTRKCEKPDLKWSVSGMEGNAQKIQPLTTLRHLLLKIQFSSII